MTPALLALAVLVAAPAAKDPPKTDPPSLVGEWAIESSVEGGKPDQLPPGMTWTFTADGKSVLKVGGVAVVAIDGTYTADPKKAPAQLDVDGGIGGSLRAIYKVEKDTLTLCFVDGAPVRPTEFASPAGSKVVLLTLTRVKAKD